MTNLFNSTAKTAAIREFEEGNEVLCPSIGEGIKSYVLTADPLKQNDLLAITAQGSHFYFDKKGFSVSADNEQSKDLAPSLFYDTPENRHAIALLYGIHIEPASYARDISHIPYKLVDKNVLDFVDSYIHSTVLSMIEVIKILGELELVDEHSYKWACTAIDFLSTEVKAIVDASGILREVIRTSSDGYHMKNMQSIDLVYKHMSVNFDQIIQLIGETMSKDTLPTNEQAADDQTFMNAQLDFAKSKHGKATKRNNERYTNNWYKKEGK